MQAREGKEPDDSQIAHFLVEETTESTLTPTEQDAEAEKRSEAAKLLSKLGASKGGKARSDKLSEKKKASIGRKGGNARKRKLTPEQRSEIAKKAAKARWGKKS